MTKKNEPKKIENKARDKNNKPKDGPYVPVKPRNIEVRHKSKKSAREAAVHATGGKLKPTPSKKAPAAKRKSYKEQQKYKNPERHPGSKHDEPHFHDSNKSLSPINRHHKYPER